MSEINVKGMSCQHCVASVTQALNELGLENVKVDLENGTAEFDHNSEISMEAIKNAMEEIGFELE